jgi:hypothetical protein
MRRTNIYLDERQTLTLDRLARERDSSRAEVIRQLLDRALGLNGDRVERDIAAIDSAFGAAADFPDVDRRAGTREDRLAELFGVDESSA